MISKDMNEWFEHVSRDFFKDIGTRKNQFILDFGCGKGNYVIPAAMVVGESGKVYAVDKNSENLDKLVQIARKSGFKNIIIKVVGEETQIPINDQYIDIVLLYDVLHLVKNRDKLLTELHRILKPNKILSVYPKHHQEDMEMSLEEVKLYIESTGFRFEKKFFKTLIHDDKLESGYVLNFRKCN